MKNSVVTRSRFIGTAIIVGIAISSATLCSQEKETNSKSEKSKVLVSADWLASAIKTNDNLRVIDLPLRKTNFKTGHIPGAVYVDWRVEIIDSNRKDLYRLPQEADMERLLSRLGVDKKTTVVVTDNMANRCSVRMYYTLKYFGHKDVRILNGGTNAWANSKRDLTTEVPSFPSTKYRISKTYDKFVAKIEAVHEAISSDCQLIDSRPEEQYVGDKHGKVFHTNKAHDRLGHVPSATNIPWQENLNADGTFKSIDELRELYESHGIVTAGDIITYCNEGLHAAMPWFILRELLGNKDVKNFDDSMGLWANRSDTPLKTRDEK